MVTIKGLGNGHLCSVTEKQEECFVSLSYPENFVLSFNLIPDHTTSTTSLYIFEGAKSQPTFQIYGHDGLTHSVSGFMFLPGNISIEVGMVFKENYKCVIDVTVRERDGKLDRYTICNISIAPNV